MAKDGGFLLLPRVRVFWGDINLTSYDGASKGAPEVFLLDSEKGSPLVYDVKVDLTAEGEGPKAQFMWDPSGPGFKAYEWFLANPKYLQGKISIEYFYPGGKRIAMFFRWQGQTINYGNDMTVTVKLMSELAGLVNANQRSTAQAYDEKKGKNLIGVYNRAINQFGLQKEKNILTFNKVAKEQSKDVEILNAYGASQTFGSTVANLAQQAGHAAYGNAIKFSGIIIFPPYSAKDSQDEEVFNAATKLKKGEIPNPASRYGYLLGPSVIDSIQRDYTWKPPQQSNSKTPGTQQFATQPRDANGRFRGRTEAEREETNRQRAAASTSSPLGTANNRANPGVQFKKNRKGPDRQNSLNEEKTATLSFTTYMCPVLTGVKPHDILFVPSLDGKNIEDWIVQSVTYSSSNGKVDISIQATRVFGLATQMNKKVSETFLSFAKEKGLVGSGGSLEAWESYAWSLPG